MKVLPTLDGGLRLEIEGAPDWQALMAISIDAERDLASELSALMDQESMWEDIVVPELQGYFSGQLEHVLKTVRLARKKSGDEESGEVHIPREDGETWYGALNQARLALEEKHQFGPAEEIKSFANLPASKRNAFFRDRFYCHLQGLLMEYVME